MDHDIAAVVDLVRTGALRRAATDQVELRVLEDASDIGAAAPPSHGGSPRAV
jgi:hypothetical protein